MLRAQSLAVVAEQSEICPAYEETLLSPLEPWQKQIYLQMGKPAVRPPPRPTRARIHKHRPQLCCRHSDRCGPCPQAKAMVARGRNLSNAEFHNSVKAAAPLR